MNFLTIAGHLGADPETRFTSSGQKVTVLRVAARVRKGGKDETVWWRVTIWGEQFDKMIPHFKKGSAIIVFGEMHKPEIFMDKEGKPQVSMNMTASNIQFTPFGKPDRQESSVDASSHGVKSEMGAPSFAMAGKMTEGKSDISDDEVPF